MLPGPLYRAAFWGQVACYLVALAGLVRGPGSRSAVGLGGGLVPGAERGGLAGVLGLGVGPDVVVVAQGRPIRRAPLEGATR